MPLRSSESLQTSFSAKWSPLLLRSTPVPVPVEDECSESESDPDSAYETDSSIEIVQSAVAFPADAAVVPASVPILEPAIVAAPEAVGAAASDVPAEPAPALPPAPAPLPPPTVVATEGEQRQRKFYDCHAMESALARYAKK